MKRLYDWACGCAEMLASAALALIAVLNLLFCTVLATDESSMFIARSGLPFLLSLALWAALLWLLAGSWRVRGALSRLRPETMYALCAGVYVLMAAYPVRGLDINSSYLIYHLLNKQKENGVAVIFVGEDLDVLIGLCDRILVMNSGVVTGIVDGRTAKKDEIGLLMTKSVSKEKEG